MIKIMTDSDKEKGTAVLRLVLPYTAHGRQRCYASDYP